MKVMAPPVGENFHAAAHQAWIATTGNETMLNSNTVEHPPTYDLRIPLASTPSKTTGVEAMKTSGTPIFGYEQQSGKGANPLFNFTMPFPDAMVGVRPTYAGFGPSVAGKGKGQPTILAAGAMFLYHNVDLNAVRLRKDGQQEFTPCFQNDTSLPVANIAVHLSQINQRRSNNHLHAKHVWTQMLTMYPWMQSEFGNIDFPGFDVTKCPPSPNVGVQYGPGNDCEVPIMLLSAGGGRTRQKR